MIIPDATTDWGLFVITYPKTDLGITCGQHVESAGGCWFSSSYS